MRASDAQPKRGCLPLDWDCVPYDPRVGEFPEIPPVLPDDGGSTCGAPASGIDLRTGKMACSIVSRAARLKWSLDTGDAIKLPLTPQGRWYVPARSRPHCSPCPERSEKGHEQVLIDLGGHEVAVDREVAPLLQALNDDAGIHTLTSCRNGFVMFIESDWNNLCAFWQRNEAMIGAPAPYPNAVQPRNSAWLQWIRANYPPHFPIHLDQAGMVTTICWLFDPDELRAVMPALVAALQAETPAPRAEV